MTARVHHPVQRSGSASPLAAELVLVVTLCFLSSFHPVPPDAETLSHTPSGSRVLQTHALCLKGRRAITQKCHLIKNLILRTGRKCFSDPFS